MSRVFLGREIALDRRVVVKVLAPELAEGLSAERFAREAKLAARLQDPHIVPVLAAGTVADLPYYTMPFVEGDSLRARLSRNAETGSRATIPEAISVLRDVALALEYAHTHDVVHRDIKPENVLLSGRTAVVTDFGIAKAINAAKSGVGRPERGSARDPFTGALTQLGQSLGTPAYMPPEQASGDSADHRADLYSWGVMAYEVLAGQHPFSDKVSAQQFVAAHIAESPRPIASRRADLPPTLSAIVMRCLEKDPAARPVSAREVIAALDSANLGAATPAAPRRAHKPWVVGGIAGAVAAAALVATLVMRRDTPSVNVDPNVIAVLPFRIASPDPSLAYLREGMVDLIAAKLVREPRVVDQRSLLAGWRRAGGTATDDLDRANAIELAQSLGAGRLIEGDIVGSPTEITINASLVSLPNGNEVRESAHGAAAQLAVLVDSVVAKLLSRDAGESAQRLPTLAATPIAALQAYLAGQALYRAGRYVDAENRYFDAVGIDSTFALAGLGIVKASGWTQDPRAPRGRAIAVRHIDKLGPADRLSLGTIDPDTAATTYAQGITRSEQAVEIAPDSPELWLLLGDRLFHYGPGVLGEQTAATRAIAAMERSMALDPSFTPALEHLPYLYGITGDTASQRVAIDRLMRDSTVFYYPANQLFYARDSSLRAAALRSLTSAPASLIGYTAVVGHITGLEVSDVEQLLPAARARATTAGDRELLAQAEYMIAMNSGQPAHGLRVAADVPSRYAERMLVATFWDGDSTAAAAQYRETVPRVSAATPSDLLQRESWISAISDLAQYELARGDTTHVSRVIARLRELPPVPHNPVESARPVRLALMLDAQLAARSGRQDATRLMESLDSLMRLSPIGGQTRAAGNLVVSRLLERAGATQRAYDAVQRWMPGAFRFEGIFQSAYLREQGRLAALLGKREAAIAAYGKYLMLRTRHEPALARDVAAVRAELAKLEQQSAGR